MPHLVLIVAGENPVMTRRLPVRGRCSIGRADDNEIHLPAAAVAAHHAALRVDDHIVVEAVESTVHVNRIDHADGSSRLVERIVAPGETADVTIGDCIVIGTSLLILHRENDLGVADRYRQIHPDCDSRKNAESIEAIISDPAMRQLHAQVHVAAASELNVLLLGETGVGKEVFAKIVHRHSLRARGPIVSINCVALPESMLESELFGHTADAYTGARYAKPGLLEVAEGGTVFLDEIGEMSMSLQAKLLRVIEERAVRWLGGTRERKIDCRFVAATNRDLEYEAQQGRFRRDLLFRLNGIAFHIPPLRERRREIVPLAEYFLSRAAKQNRHTIVPVLSLEAKRTLEGYAWPGNVRELKNVIERAFVMSVRREEIGPEAIQFGGYGIAAAPPLAPQMAEPIPDSGVALRVRNSTEEEHRIRKALEICEGNQTEAAVLLGISRRGLLYKMDLYRMPRPRKGMRARHQR